MINRYRKRFILMAMLSLLFVLVIIIGSINIFNKVRINNDNDKIIDRLMKDDNFIPQDNQIDENKNEPHKIEDGGMMFFGPEGRFQTRYFVVNINESGDIESIDLSFIASVDDDTACEYANYVLKKSSTKGYYQNYRYAKSDDGLKIVFLESTRELETAKNFLLISVAISAAGYLLVFILIVLLSKIVVRPFVKNQEKQKRFITDASHELKTPLTIISANVEVLELENGESDWTKSINKQVDKLNKLTNQLTILSKMDEGIEDFKFDKFNLSEIMNETIDDFRNIFKTNDNDITINVEDDVVITGNQELINELLFILLDNARKYSTGNIFIELKNENKFAHIIFSNDANVPDGNLDYLFNRFTRLDSDRNSKSGGSGIGLSIAKEIVDLHKGQIKVKGENNLIKFDIFLNI